jgi:hypothetical protein
MIGGIDIRLPTHAGRSSVEIGVRAIRQRWNQAVFENGLTGDRYDHFWQIPFGEIEELFVYRDSASADLWDAEGAIPRAYNTMIHIIYDEEMLTIVVDDRTAAMNELIAAIESGLRDEILYIPAELEAA